MAFLLAPDTAISSCVEDRHACKRIQHPVSGQACLYPAGPYERTGGLRRHLRRWLLHRGFVWTGGCQYGCLVDFAG